MATSKQDRDDRVEIVIPTENRTVTIFTRVRGRPLKLTHVEEVVRPKVAKTLEYYATQVSPNINHLYAALFHLGITWDDRTQHRSRTMRVMTGESLYAGMGNQEMLVIIGKTPYTVTYPNTLGRTVRDTLQKIRQEGATVEELRIGGVYVREAPPQSS